MKPNISTILSTLDARVAALAERERLEGEMWQQFRAWFGWDRPLARTRRNGHRRYHLRHVHAAAAYLGCNHVTVYRSVRRDRPTTAILQGLVMLPYPTWSAMAPADARRHAKRRMALWQAAQRIGHGDARRIAAEWRRQWARTVNGRTVLHAVQGVRVRREVKAERRTA